LVILPFVGALILAGYQGLAKHAKEEERLNRELEERIQKNLDEHLKNNLHLPGRHK
jgi:hypothetical protein